MAWIRHGQQLKSLQETFYERVGQRVDDFIKGEMFGVYLQILLLNPDFIAEDYTPLPLIHEIGQALVVFKGWSPVEGI